MPPETDCRVDLRGRAAIVTGGGAGCGRSIALALAAAGAAVVVNDLNPDRAEVVRAEIAAGGGRALACPGDISNRFQAANLIERARDQFRPHLAAGQRGQRRPAGAPLAAAGRVGLAPVAGRQSDGRLLLHAAAGPRDAEEGGGVILNVVFSTIMRTIPRTIRPVSTIVEPIPGTARPDNSGMGGGGDAATGDAATVAARAGLLGLTQQSAHELAPLGIRVNALCAATDADPAEVAAVALYLCSEAAATLNGQSLQVGAGA